MRNGYAIAADCKINGYVYLSSLNPPRVTTSEQSAIRLRNLVAAVKICEQANSSDVSKQLGYEFFFAQPI